MKLRFHLNHMYAMSSNIIHAVEFNSDVEVIDADGFVIGTANIEFNGKVGYPGRSPGYVRYFDVQEIKRGPVMYVYVQSESDVFTVGFYDPEGKWHPESDHSSSEKAAQRVAYLNGSQTN